MGDVYSTQSLLKVQSFSAHGTTSLVEAIDPRPHQRRIHRLHERFQAWFWRARDRVAGFAYGVCLREHLDQDVGRGRLLLVGRGLEEGSLIELLQYLLRLRFSVLLVKPIPGIAHLGRLLPSSVFHHRINLFPILHFLIHFYIDQC